MYLYTQLKHKYFFLCTSDFDLNAQLCTYKKTSYEGHYQHFYKCKTCDTYVCIVCKEVCHQGHYLVYEDYDNAYCSCGKKGDESCKALTQRTSTPDADTVEKEPTASSPLLSNQGKYFTRSLYVNIINQ